ncbi:hypothetical protein AG1IA_02930 [Rhizoctonia solani AG-1 IA]|uniref:Uncharacterized protein n=1 Tax=Thanatephorus cucumeris (strain AG1-IA) TaxID=983506 RepID=L8WYF1_THACA|nr:hypothetical protein AG1IA_02930 [Rhizoctonia solani AG-1 IA]
MIEPIYYNARSSSYKGWRDPKWPAPHRQAPHIRSIREGNTGKLAAFIEPIIHVTVSFRPAPCMKSYLGLHIGLRRKDLMPSCPHTRPMRQGGGQKWGFSGHGRPCFICGELTKSRRDTDFLQFGGSLCTSNLLICQGRVKANCVTSRWSNLADPTVVVLPRMSHSRALVGLIIMHFKLVGWGRRRSTISTSWTIALLYARVTKGSIATLGHSRILGLSGLLTSTRHPPQKPSGRSGSIEPKSIFKVEMLTVVLEHPTLAMDQTTQQQSPLRDSDETKSITSFPGLKQNRNTIGIRRRKKVPLQAARSGQNRRMNCEEVSPASDERNLVRCKANLVKCNLGQLSSYVYKTWVWKNHSHQLSQLPNSPLRFPVTFFTYPRILFTMLAFTRLTSILLFVLSLGFLVSALPTTESKALAARHASDDLLGLIVDLKAKVDVDVKAIGKSLRSSFCHL